MRRIPLPLSPITRVTGRELWRTLGFANERAFQRARQAKTIALPLYPLPNQARGVYARSDDLAVYLANTKTTFRRTGPMKT